MHESVNPWMILPFALLLGAIACMPLLAHQWWEKHYPKVAIGLGLVALFYYIGVLKDFQRPLHSIHEYLSFICLIGSLFVVSGGIHIRVKGESKPWMNTLLLLIGGILANIIGTTGASMLLIRPFLRTNKYRLTAYHVVFFIFIVSNVGGLLTPIGDPPLYLGYLKGVPFFWTTTTLFPVWLAGMAWLLTVFYFFDYYNFLRAPADVREKETAHETWKFDGLHNLLWIGLILAALFINKPLFLRESVMIFVGFISWRLTKTHIYEANDFSWEPIREVAILFVGIFITMMPALDWLEGNAAKLGISSVATFYWASGLLSAVLDNAPTYLNFLSAAIGLFVDDTVVQGVRHFIASGSSLVLSGPEAQHADQILKTAREIRMHYPEAFRSGKISLEQIQICHLLANHALHISAVSVGSVFFGACTYIGNGPNFMVKSIAEQWGAKMPTFFGFIFKFSIPILFPMLLGIWWLFFR